MSSETEEERRESIRTDPVVSTDSTVVATPTVMRERVVSDPAFRQQVGASAHLVGNQTRESVVVRRNTNVGAIVAMVIGAIVLVFGIYLIFSRVFPYLPYPYSIFAILIPGSNSNRRGRFSRRWADENGVMNNRFFFV